MFLGFCGLYQKNHRRIPGAAFLSKPQFAITMTITKLREWSERCEWYVGKAYVAYDGIFSHRHYTIGMANKDTLVHKSNKLKAIPKNWGYSLGPLEVSR